MMKLLNNIKINIEEYLFYLFIFLLPWQARWIVKDSLMQGEIFEYGRISVYAFDIVAIILLLFYLFKNRQWKCLISKPWVGFGFFVLASSLWADDKLISAYWGMRMLLGVGLFVLIQKISFSRFKVAVLFMITGLLQGILGAWQFINQEVLGSKWLGMADHYASSLGGSVIEFGLERWLRAYGSLPHPNIYGALLVISFIFSLYYLVQIKHKYNKLFLIFTFGFIWVGILFSYSRAAWLIFILLYILGFSWILIGKSSEMIKKFASWMIVYGVIFFFVFIVATLPLVQTRLGIGGLNRLEIKSNSTRVSGYIQAGELIKENIWIGSGVGNYSLRLVEKYPKSQVWDIQPVHNVYVLILAELGIVGLLWLGWINWNILVMLWRRQDFIYLYMLLAVYGLWMFDHFWWTTGMGIYLIWLLMGLAVRGSEEDV